MPQATCRASPHGAFLLRWQPADSKRMLRCSVAAARPGFRGISGLCKSFVFSGSGARTRTWNLRINSPSRYRLRYAGVGKGLMAQNSPRSPQSLEYYSGWAVGSRVFLPFFPRIGVSLGVGRPCVSEISASSPRRQAPASLRKTLLPLGRMGTRNTGTGRGRRPDHDP